MSYFSLRNWESAISDGGTLSISFGKDSLACLGACEHLGWKIKRIVHAEVWATDTIPADLPPMVEFKEKACRIIKERYGLEVERYRADTTFEEQFYSVYRSGERAGTICGWPFLSRPWCNWKLKKGAIAKCPSRELEYVGIASDEKDRLYRLSQNVLSPINEIGWEEDYCGLWCTYNDLLSPDYDDSYRGGCWFCHNQSVGQLRLLRKNYPEYWQLLLKWDSDSPVSFKADGKTVHDYDKRFQYEDEGAVPTDRTFRWDMLERPLQISLWRMVI